MHSLSHALGGINPRLHHGTLNAIFLPAVITFNRKAETVLNEHKMQRIATAMGLADEGRIEDAIRQMTRALGLPTGLRELGVSEELFPRIIQARWPITATAPTHVRHLPKTTSGCLRHPCNSLIRCSTNNNKSERP